ncbi:MAG TPA: methyltransferase [Terriglobales bacterium]|nr:methyltransferase [Terriglobales bacterium]
MASTITETSAPSTTALQQRLMQAANGFVLSACLHVAARLNIADRLAGGPRPVKALAAETESNADALYRVLRALVSIGIFSEPQPRIIALSPAAELLRSDVAGNVHDLVLWGANPFLMHVTSDLLHSVQTGKPAVEHLYGKPAFECFASMPEVSYAFNEGMTAISADLAPAVLEAYDFSGVGTLMDVAGGHGYFLCQALRRYPQMKGILLDQPSVVEGAKCVLCEMRVEERCQPIGGDFFEHIPAGADAYFMQHIIHDWKDELALKILGNVRQALAGRPHGRLILVDMVMPEDSRPHPAKLLDLLMLMFPGGRERTEAEWRDLLATAGFTITRIVPTKAPDSVIEAAIV